MGERSRGRGQVTMFVIIGLALLMVVGVLYLVSSAQRDSRSLRDRAQGTIAASDMALIDRHIGSCLDAIVTDELRIIGDTGALAKNGPSAIVGFGDAQKRVGYGVTRNGAAGDTDVLPIASAPPRYPDRGVGIENSTIDPSTGRPFPAHSGGYFGDVQFVAACDRKGPNAPGSVISCASYPGSPPGTLGPSVQETLEHDIAQRVAACASPRVFSDALGRDVTRVGDPTVGLAFAPGKVSVVLEYPIELQGDVVLMTAPISRAYDVRLLNVLQFASDLAREEARNITFRIDTDYRDVPSWKGGFSVSRSRDIVVLAPISGGSVGSLSSGADMVIISDAQSDLAGAAYTFRFLIEHRLPMLAPLSDAQIRRYFRDGERPDIPIAADPDDGILPFDDPRIARTDQGSSVRVDVFDADCPRPYSEATCYDGYDFAQT